jgi:hypothetical protein
MSQDQLTYAEAFKVMRRLRDSCCLQLSEGVYTLHPGGRVNTADARRLIKRLAVLDVGLICGIPQSWRYQPPTPVNLYRTREPSAARSMPAERAAVPRSCRVLSDQARRQKESESMDTSKYLKGNNITAKSMKEAGEEVQEVTIADTQDGKYGLELVFENRDRVTLNATNLKKMHRHYGVESTLWVGIEIKLVLGELTYEDEQVDSILIVPVSPDVSKEKRREAKKKADEADPSTAAASNSLAQLGIAARCAFFLFRRGHE